jgi:hypothetical protein
MEYDFNEQLSDGDAVKACLRVKFTEPFAEYLNKMNIQQVRRLHEYATAQKNMDRVIEWLVTELNMKPAVEDHFSVLGVWNFPMVS